MKAAATAAVEGQLKTRRGGMLIELVNSTYGRKLAAKRMRTETAKKAPIAHYPAPHALIELWENHGGNPQDMAKAEIASFARLMVTDTSRNLVRVFFLREKLKGLADGEWTGRHVHVIGAGAMGGDIAAWCAWHGFIVTLADMKAEPLGKAIERAATLYGKIGHKRIETRDALDRLIPDLTGEGVRSADLVIEAVPETLELKRKVYAATEPKMRPGAILATNTSSIPLEELRVGLQRPDHLVGLHFFNPVSRMQLVEVVSQDQVAPDVLAKARAFLGRIDRLPAPVKSAPGFLVNRALTPYMLEAMVMLDEGIKRETIDAAAVDFGMPMGPIELADTVGLDICLHVAETLKAGLVRPMPDPVPAAAEKGRGGRTRPQERQGLLRVEARRGGEGSRRAEADRGDDRSPHPPHARRMRRLPARGGGRGRGHARRRDDFRHRLRPVPRRPHALHPVARRGEYLRRAQTIGATLRRALSSRSRLGPAGVTGVGGDLLSPSP